MKTLQVLSAGPALAVQDLGRPGYHAKGLTKGGAADPTALAEGAALLQQPTSYAALEMIGLGGRFSILSDVRIALTGAQMRCDLNGTPLQWNTTHWLPTGSILTIGGAERGTYGYLHLGGGIDTPRVMGARATHAPAGIGTPVATGDILDAGSDDTPFTQNTLTPDARLTGGALRFVPSMQTHRFTAETLDRFQQTAFIRDPKGNRQGIRMASQGDGFFAQGQLNIVSEVIVAGDIQITGDGAPYVLGPDCQTTGGYPRIGTVIPSDLPRVMQAQPGASFRFEYVTLDQAVDLEKRARAKIAALPGRVQPLVQDPSALTDLLTRQLISGAISATDNPFQETPE